MVTTTVMRNGSEITFNHQSLEEAISFIEHQHTNGESALMYIKDNSNNKILFDYQETCISDLLEIYYNNKPIPINN